MRTIDAVKRAVDTAYATLDAPVWPDPHQGRRVEEAEYGRFTNPQRYRALSLRLSAWLTVLHDRFGIVADDGVTPDGDTLSVADGDTLIGASTAMWRSPRHDSLGLRITQLDVDGQTVIQFGIEDDPVDFAIIPECGCDACDTGSADLLADLDDVVVSAAAGDLTVVLGPADEGAVHLAPAFVVVGTGDGWSYEGDGPAEPAEIVDAVRSGDDPHLPDGCVVRHGAPWIS